MRGLIRYPAPVKALRNASRQANFCDRVVGDGLRIEDDKIARIAGSIVDEAEKPSLVVGCVRSGGHHRKLARDTEAVEVLRVHAPALEVVLQKLRENARSQRPVCRERINGVVALSGPAIVDLWKLDGAVVDLLLLRL